MVDAIMPQGNLNYAILVISSFGLGRFSWPTFSDKEGVMSAILI